MQKFEDLTPSQQYVLGNATPTVADLVIFDMINSISPALRQIEKNLTLFKKTNFIA